jgi:peptide/nickel transport system substrate-binding protein
MEENEMQRKYILLTCLIIAGLILSACQTAATPTVVTTEAPTAPAATMPAATVPAATTAPTTAAATVAPTTEVAPTGKTVATITWVEEPDNLNPLYSNMSFSSYLTQIWSAWAWEFDDKGQPYPKLVKEIPSLDNGGIAADGKTITMTLRSDVVWSDGVPLTSADFKFTQAMATNPKNTVATTYPYDKIQSIDTPDDHTVVMHFADPFAPWLAKLWQGILPSHILQPIFDKNGTLDHATWPIDPSVSLGPYVLDKWESGSYLRFVKNDKYWATPAKIDEIFVRIVPDEAAQVASLQAGDADLGYWFQWNNAQKLKDAGFTIDVVPNGFNEGMFLLVNNTNSKYNGKVVGNPALLDLKVRQAIAMAIDRETINQNLNLGYTKVPDSYWDSIPLYNDITYTAYKYDPEAAKKLLDEAGWVDSNGDGTRDKNGVELVLRYVTTNNEKRQKAQVIVQQDLKAVGIGTDISSIDSTLYFAGYADGGPVSTGQVDLQEWSDVPAFPDPDIYYWLCNQIPTADNPSGANSFFLCDKQLDALITLQATQLDYNARHQTISQINKIMEDNVYWLGLWQDPDDWAVSSKLHNVKFSPVNPFYNITEWTKTP